MHLNFDSKNGDQNRLLSRIVVMTCLVVIWLIAPAPLSAQYSNPGCVHRYVYTDIDVGIPVATGSINKTAHGIADAGYGCSITVGTAFNTVISAELSAGIGHISLNARKCCTDTGYWLGADGNRYLAPVAGMNGVYYTDMRSSVILQHYKARVNINLLALFSGADNRTWSVGLSPLISMTGSHADIISRTKNTTVIPGYTRWHFGYGGGINALRTVSRKVSVGLYSDIIWLTGHSINALPAMHNNNMIWETGVKVRYIINFIPCI